MTYIYGMDRDRRFISRHDLGKRKSKFVLGEVSDRLESTYKSVQSAIDSSPSRKPSTLSRLGSAARGVAQLPTKPFTEPLGVLSDVVRQRSIKPVIKQGSDILGMLTSGEKAANYTVPGLGSAIRGGIERIPKVGKPAAAVADIATSPLTLATAGGAGALAGGGNVLGRMVAPVAGKTFGTRLAAETGIGAGALAGSYGGKRVAEELGAPKPVQGAAALAGGLAGGMAGVRGAQKAFGGAGVLAGSARGMEEPLESLDDQLPRIGGAAELKSPIQFRTPETKLTPTERASDVVNRGLKFMVKTGVTESKEATPIRRESKALKNNILNTTRQLSTISSGVEHELKVDSKTGLTRFGVTVQDLADDFDKYEKLLTPQERTLLSIIRDKQERLTELSLRSGILKEEDLIKPKSPRGFWLSRYGTIGDAPSPELLPKYSKAMGEAGFEKPRRYPTMAKGREAGDQYPSFSNAMDAYGKALASRVEQEYAKPYIKGLAEYAEEQGIPTGGRVDISGEAITDLPPAWADTLNREFGAKQTHDSEFYHIVNAVNQTGKSVWASADGSFAGIQGLLLMATAPARAGKALALSFRSMVDPSFKAEFIAKHDRLMESLGKPTWEDAGANGLHFAGAKGEGLDIRPETEGLLGKISGLPVIKQTNRLYSDMGDFYRGSAFDIYYDTVNSTGKGLLVQHKPGEAKNYLREIASASNRATGYSETAFGGDVGKIMLFAPKFLQSQLEVITEAVSDGGLEGQIARQQLIRLMGWGIGLTFAANAIKTGSADPMDWAGATDLDITSSNFMRIRNIGGADISLFGPWDSLVRGVVAAAQGDPNYMLRSKASPIVSKGWDLFTGKDFLGQDTRDPENFIRSLLPFSTREAGIPGIEGPLGAKEPLTSTALGFAGIKSSPLSRKEKVDQALESAGISRDDPEYEIKRREYISTHPEIVPSAVSEKGKRAEKISKETREREKTNNDKALDDTQTLVQFRENRSDINTAQRIRLEEAVGKFKDNPKTQQQKWLSSYFKLYDQAKDDINPDKVDSKKLDPLVAEWVNTNGEQALDFIRRYMQAGQTEVDKQYIKDLQTLDKAGFFNTPKYQRMRSGLSDDDIDKYRDMVSAARKSDPRLDAGTFGAAANKVLHAKGLSRIQIQDVIRAGSENAKSKSYLALKRKYGKELLWFDENIRWSDYKSYKPRRISSAIRR